MTHEECEQLVLCYSSLVEAAQEQPTNINVCEAEECLREYLASLVYKAHQTNA